MCSSYFCYYHGLSFIKIGVCPQNGVNHFMNTISFNPPNRIEGVQRGKWRLISKYSFIHSFIPSVHIHLLPMHHGPALNEKVRRI